MLVELGLSVGDRASFRLTLGYTPKAMVLRLSPKR